MFLLLAAQPILLFGCLMAGAKNAAFQRFLAEHEMAALTEMDVGKAPLTPRQLSMTAMIVLIIGMAAFFRYWRSINRKIAQAAAPEGHPPSEYENARKKKFFAIERTTKTLHTVLLILSVIPAIVVIPVLGFGEPGVNALIAAYMVTFWAAGAFMFTIAVWLLIALGQLVSLVCASLSLRNARPAKAQIITGEIKRVFGENSGYEPNGHFYEDPFETDVLKRYDHLAANDHLFGVYRGLAFEQMDVLFYDGGLPKTGQAFLTSDLAHKQNGFKGRWIIVHQPKAVAGRFYIVSKDAYADERKRFKNLPGLSEVFLEDTEYNNRFVVYAQTPHDVFYVMTPQLIGRLKKFADRGAGKPDFSIRLGFYENRIHFVVSGLTDAFEHLFGAFDLDASISEESARASVRRDLNLITDFIDSLFGPKEASKC
ncbi:MAG: DUF3137 domain-containing protein [Firmicutes bacterium]|nr:DUF3137 domain-containing protein [Bacillota bacterium]